MERGKDWQVTLVQEDALLFNAARTSLEIYSRLALTDAQQTYDQAITKFPV
jgi:hypothetical protein